MNYLHRIQPGVPESSQVQVPFPSLSQVCVQSRVLAMHYRHMDTQPMRQREGSAGWKENKCTTVTCSCGADAVRGPCGSCVPSFRVDSTQLTPRPPLTAVRPQTLPSSTANILLAQPDGQCGKLSCGHSVSVWVLVAGMQMFSETTVCTLLPGRLSSAVRVPAVAAGVCLCLLQRQAADVQVGSACYGGRVRPSCWLRAGCD